MSEKRCYTVQELQEILRMCTLIFWMMTEGKMQNFLKKHFMRKKSGPTDVWTAGK